MDDLALLKKKIQQDRGFNCGDYKETSLKRRLSIRMKATKTETYGDYMAYLSAHPDEYEHLIDALTVNFTEFFRDKEMYEFMREEILPEIIERKRSEGRKIIRFWSAGCSSGQEPYSLAIMVMEFLGEELKNFIVSIRASDIDDRCLATAKKGVYDDDSLKKMDPFLVEKYFEPKDGMFRVKDSVRELIKFEKHDLISGSGKRYFDVILCRNVFIYFSRERQKAIFEMFHDALNKNGYLIIGKTETMHEELYRRFEMVSLSERIFQRAG